MKDVVTRRYEIMQKFIAGVRSVEVHSALATKYAEEKYVKDPPTEEDLRYVAMEFVRLRKPRWEQQVFQPTQIPPPSPGPSRTYASNGGSSASRTEACEREWTTNDGSEVLRVWSDGTFRSRLSKAKANGDSNGTSEP